MDNHPRTMSSIMQMILFIVVSSISVALLSFLDIPKGIGLVLLTITSTVYPMFLIYKSNSLPAIEKYIIRHRQSLFNVLSPFHPNG